MSLAELTPENHAEPSEPKKASDALLLKSAVKWREANEKGKTLNWAQRYLEAASLLTLGSMENDTLKRLKLLARAALAFEELGEQLEEAAKVMTGLSKSLVERTIPEIMENVEMDHFGLTAGHEVHVKDVVHASIKKENMAAGCELLKKLGAAAIIKRTVSVPFTTKQGELADKVVAAAKKALGDAKVEVVDESAVHHSTLSAWAREQLRNGVEISTEEMKLLGIFRRRMAVITEKKD